MRGMGDKHQNSHIRAIKDFAIFLGRSPDTATPEELCARLEIADIFRADGPAWRQANAGHVSVIQLKVMSVIEACRTGEIGMVISKITGFNLG